MKNSRFISLSMVAGLAMVLLTTGCDPKQSKEYKDLEAKMAAMTAQDSIDKAQVQVYRDVTNAFLAGKTDEFGKYVADNIVDHNPDTMLTKKTGLEGMVEMAKALNAAYSEMTFNIEYIASKGDMVYAFGKMGGKNTGPMMPGMKPTGKSYNVDFFEAVKFGGGKMTERWGLFDSYAFMQQMGMM